MRQKKTKRTRHLSQLLYSLVAGVGVIIVLWVAFSRPAPTQVAPQVSVGSVAPDFALTDIYGDPVRLSDHRGKVVVVEFMRTSCPHCVNEMAQLVGIMGRVNDATIISLSVDPEGDTDLVLEDFMMVYGAPYSSQTQWLFARDTAGVASLYQISSIPTIIVIDANGRIVQINIGEISSETLIQQIMSAQ